MKSKENDTLKINLRKQIEKLNKANAQLALNAGYIISEIERGEISAKKRRSEKNEIEFKIGQNNEKKKNLIQELRKYQFPYLVSYKIMNINEEYSAEIWLDEDENINNIQDFYSNSMRDVILQEIEQEFSLMPNEIEILELKRKKQIA